MNKAEFMEMMDWAKEQTMSGSIKRSDAIKALDNAWINGTSLFDANEAVKQLKDLPSADRPQGEWVMSKPEEEGFGAVFQCSQCSYEVDYVPTNFCPNCGARMKGADDE